MEVMGCAECKPILTSLSGSCTVLSYIHLLLLSNSNVILNQVKNYFLYSSHEERHVVALFFCSNPNFQPPKAKSPSLTDCLAFKIFFMRLSKDRQYILQYGRLLRKKGLCKH